jgi:ABC-type polysaccharide/polyol phosphate export permease
MLKFYKKYELSIKIFLVITALLAGIWKIFLTTDIENKNFNKFLGIVWLFVTMFLLLDSIMEFVKKRRLRKEGSSKTAE